MDKLEKVTKGLEFCISTTGCKGCPYEDPCYDIEQRILGEAIMRDALDLLKEQPKIIRCNDCKYGIRKNTDISNIYECGYPYTIIQESHYGDFFCALAEQKDGEQE